MNKTVKNTLVSGAVMLTLATASVAEPISAPLDGHVSGAYLDGSGLLDSAFEGGYSEEFAWLDGDAMHATQGDLWPFILGVATLDLGLATFFWGAYVPTMNRAGTCTACDIGSKLR